MLALGFSSLELFHSFLSSSNFEKSQPILDKILKYENIMDNVKDETSHFLSKLTERPLTKKQSEKLLTLYRIIHEIENITDQTKNMSLSYKELNQSGVSLDDEIRSRIIEVFEKFIKCVWQPILIHYKTQHTPKGGATTNIHSI